MFQTPHEMLPRLTGLRTTLRKRMLDSPLTNGVQFARDIEAAFIDTWNRYANSPIARRPILIIP